MPKPVAGQSEEDKGLKAANVAAVGTGRGNVLLNGAGKAGVVDVLQRPPGLCWRFQPLDGP